MRTQKNSTMFLKINWGHIPWCSSSTKHLKDVYHLEITYEYVYLEHCIDPPLGWGVVPIYGTYCEETNHWLFIFDTWEFLIWLNKKARAAKSWTLDVSYVWCRQVSNDCFSHIMLWHSLFYKKHKTGCHIRIAKKSWNPIRGFISLQSCFSSDWTSRRLPFIGLPKKMSLWMKNNLFKVGGCRTKKFCMGHVETFFWNFFINCTLSFKQNGHVL